MPSIDNAVAWAISIANDNTHGYDQAHRNGPDYDCSSFVATALNVGGFAIATDSWTGNLYDRLIACGFRVVNDTPRKGDVFLSHNSNVQHVVLAISDTQVVQATSNENGGITGGQTGDQTGTEICISNFYAPTGGWDYHFRSTQAVVATWHAKPTGGYSKESTEALENATLLASALSGIGWVKTAICALLGNGAGESGLNPWRWEGDYIPTYSEFLNWTIEQARTHGYGMFQFTPANKYINQANQSTYGGNGYAPHFSDQTGNASDGEAQTLFFANSVQGEWLHNLYNYYYDDFANIGVDISAWYYTTYANFIQGIDNNGNTLSLADLTGVFELVYERPSDTYAASSYWTRVDNAEYWYYNLPDIPPEPPTPPSQRKGMPWIYYLKRRRIYGY